MEHFKPWLKRIQPLLPVVHDYHVMKDVEVAKILADAASDLRVRVLRWIAKQATLGVMRKVGGGVDTFGASTIELCCTLLHIVIRQDMRQWLGRYHMRQQWRS